MRDLLHDPLWRPEHLGAPIPDSPHAVSACLPTWRDNIGYEEGERRVLDRLTTGYPRFVYNRFCRELFAGCDERFARAGETSLAFPSEAAAERCARWVAARTGCAPRVHSFGMHGVHAVRLPREFEKVAKDYWQHTGEGVSSRLAEACVGGSSECGVGSAEYVAERGAGLRSRVAAMHGVAAENVFLFPCGMSAIFALYRALAQLLPARRSVQFGFPYVDTLKVQEKFGKGVAFFPQGSAAEIDRIADLVAEEPIGGLYTEFPSNPLLSSPDLKALADLAKKHGFPLIVDDTLAACVNADVLAAADAVTTSLTKFFSGAGDVTGGALVLNPRSAFHGDLSSRLNAEFEDLLWPGDALVLERNSRDYTQRVARINATAEALADFLREHPRVARVDYPKFRTPREYAAFQRPTAGGQRPAACYGGLLSIVLEDEARAAPRFFDALRVCKGPNLGTNYTLACPYTVLAHYGELDWAESCGVSRWLVRVSVGLEEPGDLIERFAEALDEGTL
ncbi:MAG: PLP-dependent transferase [Planctomycetales bacterium]